MSREIEVTNSHLLHFSRHKMLIDSEGLLSETKTSQQTTKKKKNFQKRLMSIKVPNILLRLSFKSIVIQLLLSCYQVQSSSSTSDVKFKAGSKLLVKTEFKSKVQKVSLKSSLSQVQSL